MCSVSWVHVQTLADVLVCLLLNSIKTLKALQHHCSRFRLSSVHFVFVPLRYFVSGVNITSFRKRVHAGAEATHSPEAELDRQVGRCQN